MGTSKSSPTPSGGSWQPLKTELTNSLNSGNPVDADRVVSQAVAGFGGLSPAGRTSTSGGSGGGGGGGGGTGGGTQGGGSSGRGASARAGVGRAVASLSGFGSAVGTGTLNAGLTALGLAALQGRSAAEVVGRVAEHIASTSSGQQRELMRDALQGAILEAAQATNGTYEDLDAGLQSFIADKGAEGLVELFLGEFAANLVWYGIENHVDLKSQSLDDASALRSGVRVACENKVRDLLKAERANGTFASVDWFGNAGQARAQAIATQMERELRGSNQ